MTEDLAAEQSRLEGEIEALEASLARAKAQLDVAQRSGPRPRGLLVGLLLGAVLLMLFFGAGVLFALYSISRMD